MGDRPLCPHCLRPACPWLAPLPDGPGWWLGRYCYWGYPGPLRPFEVRASPTGEELLAVPAFEGAPEDASPVGSDDWIWLAGPDGRAVRALIVDLTDARADLEVAEMEIDAMGAEIDRLTADHQELTDALDVPEGVDPVEWAAQLLDVLNGARALLWATDHETGQAIAMANLRTVTEAATQPRPRPLPDGPGRWRGAWDGEEPRCVEVGPSFVASRGLVGDAGAGMLMPVRHEGWTWLAGPDGRAVRCTPPEVSRGE